MASGLRQLIWNVESQTELEADDGRGVTSFVLVSNRAMIISAWAPGNDAMEAVTSTRPVPSSVFPSCQVIEPFGS